MVINKYLDESISVTEESLNSLEVNRDHVVWDLATKIYSQSGHKVELSTVRDVVYSRIGAIKYQLAAQKENMAKQAQQFAEEKVRLAAQEEKVRLAAQEEKVRLAAQNESHFRRKVTHALEKLGGDEDKVRIFVRVQEIVCEQLGLNENEVNEETKVFNVEYYKGGGWFSSSIPERITAWNFKPEEASSYRKGLSTEWGDTVDAMELLMALEEEFDIEIPESDAEDLHTVIKVADYIA